SRPRQLSQCARFAAQLLQRPTGVDCRTTRRAEQPRQSVHRTGWWLAGAQPMSVSADSRQAPSPRPAGRRRAPQQRQRILDAAEKCFIESGFHAATMARIAATAGISPGLIYRYFESKSAIVRAIIERHLACDGCRVVDEREGSQSLCEGLLD